MFIDASAIVAMFLREPQADAMLTAIEQAPDRLTSAIAIWESSARLSREMPSNMADLEIDGFIARWKIQVVPIDSQVARLASLARVRYGFGKNKLNMGDCFAYACAKANGVPLLYIGNDFPKTDVNDGYTL